jgi:hypothetical protein
MKKIFLCLIAFISIQAFSQISIGITGGFIFPLNNYKDSLPKPSNAAKFGAEIVFDIHTHWKLRTGIEYASFAFFNRAMKGFTYEAYYTYNTHYLGIPVGLRYVFNGKKFNPFIDGSVSFMGNIGHNTRVSSINGTPPVASNPTPNAFVLSPALGIGMLFNPADKIYLSFMMNYTMQTGYLYTAMNNKQEFKHLRYNGIGASLSIGYNF